MRFVPTVVILCLLSMSAYATVQPAGIFAHHMVLQRDMPVPVWGTATPGEAITVSIGAHTATATAGEDGRWLATLEPLDSGGPFELTVAGTNTIVYKDVLVGEVWVCSGQSNMAMKLKDADGGPAAVAAAQDSQLRRFEVRGALSATPASQVGGRWQLATNAEVQHWSAPAYFFGQKLRAELDVPVGLIHAAIGWTPAEAWMSRESLEADPKLKPIMEYWDAVAAKNPGQGNHQHSATRLYNGMIFPVMPYAIRGAIWYQGETNASRADQYRTLFPALINGWRRSWGQGDFPFIYAQIAPLDAGPVDRAELRDAQRETLSLPNTAMVVTLDIGMKSDEHPKQKKEVGERMALAALKLAHGKDVVYSGPLYEDMRVEGQTIRLAFTHVGSGLVARGGTLKGFMIAGADKRFVPAQATIDGTTIVVTSPDVPEPVAVRYCFANWPGDANVTLFNEEGLPASSFRTDDWKLTTAGRTQMMFQ